jgi:hypothetical protein
MASWMIEQRTAGAAQRTHARTHARNARTHARTQRTHARTHAARTHARTHAPAFACDALLLEKTCAESLIASDYIQSLVCGSALHARVTALGMCSLKHD